MPKNEKTLSVSEIEQKKSDLQTDLEKITSQGNALSGAIQQCDVFLNLLGESSPDKKVPSQDDSAAVNTALS